MTIANTRVIDTIRWAYEMQTYQILGPAWINDSRFDVNAKAPAPATQIQMRKMLRVLLEQRFKLVAHPDTREFSVLELTVLKDQAQRVRRAPLRESGTFPRRTPFCACS